MRALLLDLFDELRLFWAKRPRKGFDPSRPMSATDAQKFRAGLILTRAS